MPCTYWLRMLRACPVHIGCGCYGAEFSLFNVKPSILPKHTWRCAASSGVMNTCVKELEGNVAVTAGEEE